jgi:hypothetical protein
MAESLVNAGFELEGLVQQGEVFATHVGPRSRTESRRSRLKDE